MRTTSPRRGLGLVGLVLVLGAACSSLAPDPQAPQPVRADGVTELEVQALVMGMADDWTAALGEVTYGILHGADLEPRGRWLSLSFLRNGVGNALDVATRPNPDVALLDMLVLVSLQTWNFERRWLPAGVDDETARLAEGRLRQAERAIWAAAARVMSEEQQRALRDLIDQWIAENQDKTVVGLTRFSEFTRERNLSKLAAREQASGLLAEVGEASAAVDEARLLGERALWFASRYPYLLGQQSELTLYRMADQPEVHEMRSALDGIAGATRALATRLDSLEAEEERLFGRLRDEREAAIEDLRRNLDAVTANVVGDAAERASALADGAVDRAFVRLGEERERLLSELDAREEGVRGLLAETRETLEVARAAATELARTAEAADRLVAHFDRDPSDDREPLRLEDVRAAAAEAGVAAERLTELLEQALAVTESGVWDRRLAEAEELSTGLANALFWRGAGLILLLIAGLALVRRVPQRSAA